MGMGSTQKMAKAPAKKKTPAKKAPAKKTIKKAAPKKSPAKKKTATKKKSGAKDKKDKVKRAPSAYNVFMKKELEKLKKSKPNMDHKERFKAAAQAWSKQKK